MKNLLFLLLFISVISCKKDELQVMPLQAKILSSTINEQVIQTNYCITTTNECTVNIYFLFYYYENGMEHSQKIGQQKILQVGANNFTLKWGSNKFVLKSADICSIDIL